MKSAPTPAEEARQAVHVTLDEAARLVGIRRSYLRRFELHGGASEQVLRRAERRIGLAYARALFYSPAYFHGLRVRGALSDPPPAGAAVSGARRVSRRPVLGLVE